MKNKKSLGQHWLYNREILNEIALIASGEASEGSAYDFAEKTGVETCLEIGPGLGTLTASLLKRFKRVIAVEFDENLANNLPKSFPGTSLEVVNEDILKYDFSSIKEPYVVVGNIPYYITSPIIEKVLTVANLPKRVVLLIQKEVAERILDEKESVLSLFVKNRAKVFPGPVVLKEEFTPPPKVDSQVIILEPKAPEVSEDVFVLIRKGFLAPRKKLVSNLKSMWPKERLEEIFSELEIDLNARPADLHLSDWQNLYQKLQNKT
jgi:16S rRNA (adenine1518-N6/adenine1519-N6)-dimethyltransferase